ncbi:MAG TPA: DUF1893 domain-containing protein [Clostridiaceae bacterium]|nr:DUF1893 domain-containing protein [Clostridiaceae bacterium]
MLNLLEEKNAACLIYSGDKLLHISGSIGVKPLLEFMEKYPEGSVEKDLVLIDKVIGKAALLLAVHLGIRVIYTPVASKAAVEAAELHHVELHARSVVPHIINRDKTGVCPLEQSVMETNDPVQALENIRVTIKILMAKKISNDHVT